MAAAIHTHTHTYVCACVRVYMRVYCICMYMYLGQLIPVLLLPTSAECSKKGKAGVILGYFLKLSQAHYKNSVI